MRRIDADKLGEVKFHSLPYTHITPSDVEAESYKRGWNDAIDSIIENAPTIELRCEDCEAFNKTRLLVQQPERKKGKWIDGRCSICGCDIPAYIIDWKWQKDMDANYCPVCGADMREDQHDQSK